MEIEEIKTEPVDFVREFQEYLTQQTHHVNMISGSVCGAKEPGEPFQAGRSATRHMVVMMLSAFIKGARVFCVSSRPQERAERPPATVSGAQHANRGRV